ncbi:MAG: diguanylate cyclase [Clostridia bacterium]|nr:diguanylate cyclase [Clostridia bacterium]
MNLPKKKSSILFILTAFLLFLLSCGGTYNIYLTNSIANDAMIINKLGTVRGSLQRVVKLELSDKNCDELINKIDLTLGEFQSEKIKLFDKNNDIMNAVNDVVNSWEKVKRTIYIYRETPNEENRQMLLLDSEDAWYKSNSMVFISQTSSENKISKYKLSFFVFFLNIILSIIIIFLIKRYVKDALEEMVNNDSLTGIYNRRFFTEFLRNEIIRSERYKKGFSLIMLDIDFFKKINDTYGHDVGDIVLKELSGLVTKCIRKSDMFARVGGEEFAIIATETDLENAVQLAEKIRRKVEESVLAKDLKITISLGVSQYTNKDDNNTIYKRADNALYKAKGEGRNRVASLVEAE